MAIEGDLIRCDWPACLAQVEASARASVREKGEALEWERLGEEDLCPTHAFPRAVQRLQLAESEYESVVGRDLAQWTFEREGSSDDLVMRLQAIEAARADVERLRSRLPPRDETTGGA